MDRPTYGGPFKWVEIQIKNKNINVFFIYKIYNLFFALSCLDTLKMAINQQLLLKRGAKSNISYFFIKEKLDRVKGVIVHCYHRARLIDFCCWFTDKVTKSKTIHSTLPNHRSHQCHKNSSAPVKSVVMRVGERYDVMCAPFNVGWKGDIVCSFS